MELKPGCGLEGLPGSVISDLVQVGLVSVERGVDGHETVRGEDGLSLFLPFLAGQTVRLRPMARPDCPMRFCTGILTLAAHPADGIDVPRQSIPAGGQGMTQTDASLSCLGELAERASLCSLGPEDPRVFRRKAGQPEVDLSRLFGAGMARVESLARASGRPDSDARLPAGETPDQFDRCVSVRHLIGGQVSQLPSFGVLFRETTHATGRQVAPVSSSGCAVWSTMAGARERAMLELAERDAVAQAWYNRLGITKIDKACLEEILPREIFIYLNGQPRQWGVYLVATDLAVQVAMAVSFEPGGRACAFGSSAGWDVTSACIKALEEMLQYENSLVLMERAYPAGRRTSDAGPGEPRQLSYARNRSILEDLPLDSVPVARDGELGGTSCYADLLQSCVDANIDIWEFDATRTDLGIPCVKLLSPDLCSWEARYDRQRLFQVVVDRGLRSSPATEAEFAARPFPF